MANFKDLRFTVPHGVVEDPIGTFTPASVDVQIRNADDSLETLTLPVIAVPGPKDLVLDLGANPCCTKIISGPYVECPEVVNTPADCTPPATAPQLVDAGSGIHNDPEPTP